jgi:hypothetical protein
MKKEKAARSRSRSRTDREREKIYLALTKAKTEKHIFLSLPPSLWGREKKMGSRTKTQKTIPHGIGNPSNPIPLSGLDNKKGDKKEVIIWR